MPSPSKQNAQTNGEASRKRTAIGELAQGSPVLHGLKYERKRRGFEMTSLEGPGKMHRRSSDEAVETQFNRRKATLVLDDGTEWNISVMGQAVAATDQGIVEMTDWMCVHIETCGNPILATVDATSIAAQLLPAIQEQGAVLAATFRPGIGKKRGLGVEWR